MRIRNINLGYMLIAVNNAFFWYAPWLLFLFRYIDIKQATLLQLVSLITRVVTEIPTGALADLIGKKRVITIAFFLTAVGEILMAFSTKFSFFILNFIIMSLGYSFYSGTIDAFMYDSLAENKSEKLYPKVLGKSSAYLNVSTAAATLIGGFLFRIWGGLPFLVTGLTKLVGMGITFFITEPKVDTYIFSFRNFIKLTGKGFVQLLNKNMVRYTVLILLLGSFTTIAYEILDDVAVVDWGFSAVGISILYTTVIIMSIPSGLLYEYFAKKYKPSYLVTLGIFFLVMNYLLSPWINVTLWTIFFIARVIFSPIKKAAVTDIINRHTESNIRATTLSTYELLIKLPFVFLGVSIGSSLKIFGVKYFSATFSLSLLFLLILYIIVVKIMDIKLSKSMR